jgi:hypothetical protein
MLLRSLSGVSVPFLGSVGGVGTPPASRDHGLVNRAPIVRLGAATAVVTCRAIVAGFPDLGEWWFGEGSVRARTLHPFGIGLSVGGGSPGWTLPEELIDRSASPAAMRCCDG